METFNLEYFLDRTLNLPLNSFKTKSQCMQRAADVVVAQADHPMCSWFKRIYEGYE